MAFKMRHPDVENTALAVSDAEFSTIWEPRGWQRVDPLLDAASEIAGHPVESLDDLTKPQLAELAEQQGVDVTASAKKDDLVDAITDDTNTDAGNGQEDTPT